MSLILEALRRSEEERRRHAQPLLAPAPLRRRRRGRLRALIALAVLLVVGALAGGVAWLDSARSPEAPLPVATAPSLAIGHERRDATGRAEATAVPSRANAAPPNVHPAGSQSAPQRESEPYELLREGPLITAPESPDPLADPRLDPAVRARLAEIFARAGDHPPPQGLTAVPGPAPKETVHEIPSPAPAMPPTLPAEASFEELPYSLRRELPTFRVSMIVAASEPHARFVLVEGVRRRAGEEIAPGVRIVEIDSEGLLLEFRGQRFRWRVR